MSQGTRRSLEIMRPEAEKIRSIITPHCSRAEIAGSIRRQQLWVGDIDIVCIADGWALEQFLAKWMQSGDIRHVQQGPRGSKNWSDKVKAFWYDLEPNQPPVQVDLYITTPDEWAYNFLIRTGSVGFNLRMITPNDRKTADGELGLMPPKYHFKNCLVHNADNQSFYTAEEEDIFRMWGIQFVPPHKRDHGVKPEYCLAEAPEAASTIQQPSLFALDDKPKPKPVYY